MTAKNSFSFKKTECTKATEMFISSKFFISKPVEDKTK